MPSDANLQGKKPLKFLRSHASRVKLPTQNFNR